MERAGSRKLRLLIATVNIGWAAWALAGAFYFLTSRAKINDDPALVIFDRITHVYSLLGFSLLLCGLISLCSIVFTRLGRLAAILCAVWCFGVAVTLQCSVPHAARNDVYAWLLLICAFTCAMRWALLVLEPHLVQ